MSIIIFAAVTCIGLIATAHFNIRWMITTSEVIGVKHILPILIVIVLGIACWIVVLPHLR